VLESPAPRAEPSCVERGNLAVRKHEPIHPGPAGFCGDSFRAGPRRRT
jgi:hypothetical protein